MKFQPKRFVVEVKRGTTRAAFSSPDASSDKFSAAEASLFGVAPKSDSKPIQPQNGSKAEAKIVTAPPRRILESLIEAPAPVLDEEPIERPRRGRKPGSKNKPKLVVETSAASAAPAIRPLSSEAQAFMDARPSRDLGLRQNPAPADSVAGQTTRSHVVPEAVVFRQDPKQRLRDRSKILKRYVLGSEPRAGQFGSLRARRKARAAG